MDVSNNLEGQMGDSDSYVFVLKSIHNAAMIFELEKALVIAVT